MAKEMRNSGIQWIGEIPSTWNTVRFKYLHNGLNTGEAIDKEFWSKEESDLVFYTAGLTPIRTKYLDSPYGSLHKQTISCLQETVLPMSISQRLVRVTQTI